MPESQNRVFGHTELKSFMLELKLRRVPLFAGLAIALQLVYLISPIYSTKPNTRLGVILICAVSLIFLAITLLFRRALSASARRMRAVATLFWLLLLMALTPHILTDIEYYNIPVNAILACLGLVMSPLSDRYESIGALMIFLGLNLLLCWWKNATVGYCFALFGLSGAAFLFSTLIQEQYLAIIRALQIETVHDPLTGLLNRKGGYEKLKTVFELCKRHDRLFAIYMTDIDLFKDYNDTFGHAAGDDALKRIAAAMQEIFCRASDVVCRCGGEEFFIASSLCSVETAELMAERLRCAVEMLNIPAPPASREQSMTVSIGYTVYCPSDGKSSVDEINLLSEADRALYEAKNKGRNLTCRFTK